jgi:integrase
MKVLLVTFLKYLQKACVVILISAATLSNERNRWFTEDSFRNHQGKTEPTNRKYLTELEMQKIENLSIEGELEEVRHLFLFMCYTGMPYAELFTLKGEHILLNEAEEG